MIGFFGRVEKIVFYRLCAIFLAYIFLLLSFIKRCFRGILSGKSSIKELWRGLNPFGKVALYSAVGLVLAACPKGASCVRSDDFGQGWELGGDFMPSTLYKDSFSGEVELEDGQTIPVAMPTEENPYAVDINIYDYVSLPLCQANENPDNIRYQYWLEAQWQAREGREYVLDVWNNSTFCQRYLNKDIKLMAMSEPRNQQNPDGSWVSIDDLAGGWYNTGIYSGTGKTVTITFNPPKNEQPYPDDLQVASVQPHPLCISVFSDSYPDSPASYDNGKYRWGEGVKRARTASNVDLGNNWENICSADGLIITGVKFDKFCEEGACSDHPDLIRYHTSKRCVDNVKGGPQICKDWEDPNYYKDPRSDFEVDELIYPGTRGATLLNPYGMVSEKLQIRYIDSPAHQYIYPTNVLGGNRNLEAPGTVDDWGSNYRPMLPTRVTHFYYKTVDFGAGAKECRNRVTDWPVHMIEFERARAENWYRPDTYGKFDHLRCNRLNYGIFNEVTWAVEFFFMHYVADIRNARHNKVNACPYKVLRTMPYKDTILTSAEANRNLNNGEVELCPYSHDNNFLTDCECDRYGGMGFKYRVGDLESGIKPLLSREDFVVRPTPKGHTQVSRYYNKYTEKVETYRTPQPITKNHVVTYLNPVTQKEESEPILLGYEITLNLTESGDLFFHAGEQQSDMMEIISDKMPNSYSSNAPYSVGAQPTTMSNNNNRMRMVQDGVLPDRVIEDSPFLKRIRNYVNTVIRPKMGISAQSLTDEEIYKMLINAVYRSEFSASQQFVMGEQALNLQSLDLTASDVKRDLGVSKLTSPELNSAPTLMSTQTQTGLRKRNPTPEAGQPIITDIVNFGEQNNDGGYELNISYFDATCDNVMDEYQRLVDYYGSETHPEVVGIRNQAIRYAYTGFQTIEVQLGRLGDRNLPPSGQQERFFLHTTDDDQDDISGKQHVNPYCRNDGSTVNTNVAQARYRCRFENFEKPVKVYLRVIDMDIRREQNLECAFLDREETDGKYEDNQGYMRIDYAYTSNRDFISQFIDNVIGYFRVRFDETSLNVSYNRFLVSGGVFNKLITITIGLFIALTGLAFVTGSFNISASQMVGLVVKLGMLALITSPTSWGFFKNYLYDFMTTFPDVMARAMIDSLPVSGTDEIGLKASHLYFEQKTINMILSPNIIKKVLGLFYSPVYIGYLYTEVMFRAFFSFVLIVGKITLLWIIITMLSNIYYSILPAFLGMILFERFRDLGFRMLGAVFSLGLQSIALSFSSIVLGCVVYYILRSAMEYSVCWDPVIVLNIAGYKIPIQYFWVLDGYSPMNTYDSGQLMHDISENINKGPSFFVVSLVYLTIKVKGVVTYKLVELSENLAIAITGQAGSAGTAATESIGAMVGFFSGAKGKAMNLFSGGQVVDSSGNTTSRLSRFINENKPAIHAQQIIAEHGRSADKRQREVDAFGKATIAKASASAQNIGLSGYEAQKFIDKSYKSSVITAAKNGRISTETAFKLLKEPSNDIKSELSQAKAQVGNAKTMASKILDAQKDGNPARVDSLIRDYVSRKADNFPEDQRESAINEATQNLHKSIGQEAMRRELGQDSNWLTEKSEKANKVGDKLNYVRSILQPEKSNVVADEQGFTLNRLQEAVADRDQLINQSPQHKDMMVTKELKEFGRRAREEISQNINNSEATSKLDKLNKLKDKSTNIIGLNSKEVSNKMIDLLREEGSPEAKQMYLEKIFERRDLIKEVEKIRHLEGKREIKKDVYEEQFNKAEDDYKKSMCKRLGMKDGEAKNFIDRYKTERK